MEISPILGLIRTLLVKNHKDISYIKRKIEDSQESSFDVVEYFIMEKIIKEDEIADLISDVFEFEKYELLKYDVSTFPKIEEIDEYLYRKYSFIPIDINKKKISIVALNPFNNNMKDEITFLTGKELECFVSTYTEIHKSLDKYLIDEDASLSEISEQGLEDLEFEEEKKEDSITEKNASNDAPIVKYVNKILLDAIKLNASDIHIEPYEDVYRIRFRVDGILKEMFNPPVALNTRIAARIKVMSNMDLAEKRKPQDGRIKIKVSKRHSIDFRVNTLPTLFGEKIVLRILDPSSAQLGIEALGYEDNQKEMYLEALSKPQGMIIVTGPTGSGKTVSLYTGLNILNKPEINISTVEDPVEINLQGINQVNINNKTEMTFANALRSFLRQDPDVIMVGEIRDLETAEIAVKASQTGHLVLSTLHTNSAPETLTRLSNMGIPLFNIATSVSLIIAQRLMRTLCPHCKVKADIPEKALLEFGFKKEDINIMTIYDRNKDGCEHCNHGFKGRTGIYEVVKITPRLSKAIMSGKNSLELTEICREEGFLDLRSSAILKVKKGLTNLEEANRVTTE